MPTARTCLLLGSALFWPITAVGLAPVSAGTGAAEPPFAVVVPQDVNSGDFVTVVGGGFRPNSSVVVELCGRTAVYGSPSCTTETTIDAPSDDFGRVRTLLKVQPPEEGCPCWVRIRSSRDLVISQTGVTIDGVPGETSFADTSSIATAIPAGLEVVGLRVERTAEAWSWLGARSRATVHFTIVNSGGRVVYDINVALRYGRGTSTGKHVTADKIAVLQVDDRRDMELPLDLGVLPWGRYSVVVESTKSDIPLTGSLRFSTYPWGLIVVAALAASQFLLFFARTVLRRSLASNLLEATPDISQQIAAAVLVTSTQRAVPTEASPILDRNASRQVALSVVAGLATAEHSDEAFAPPLLLAGDDLVQP
jgi:hypothetical protein